MNDTNAPASQPKPNQKPRENWQESLSSTYKLNRTLHISHSRTLGTCITHAYLTGWILYKAQYRFYKESSIGWQAYFPIFLRQEQTSCRIFKL